MTQVREPAWLSRRIVDLLHERSLRDFGGLQGVRDSGLIDSALARPVNLWAYEPAADLSALAAAYAFGLAKNHGYVDGNKRIGFLAMGVFLFTHGFLLEAPEPEAVIVMLELAAGQRTEEELASWVRDHLQARA